jgi:hypothetical protein
MVVDFIDTSFVETSRIVDMFETDTGSCSGGYKALSVRRLAMAFLFERAKEMTSSRMRCSEGVIRSFLCYEYPQKADKSNATPK